MLFPSINPIIYNLYPKFSCTTALLQPNEILHWKIYFCQPSKHMCELRVTWRTTFWMIEPPSWPRALALSFFCYSTFHLYLFPLSSISLLPHTMAVPPLLPYNTMSLSGSHINDHLRISDHFWVSDCHLHHSKKRSFSLIAMYSFILFSPMTIQHLILSSIDYSSQREPVKLC